MPQSSLLKTACLALVGVATAWSAAPAQAATPEFVAGTATATMDSSQSLTNPQFLFVSNSSDPGPIPGTVSLPTSNFQTGANPAANFNFTGDDDGVDVPVPPFSIPGTMSYMLVGLAPNGDLVAGLNPSSAATAVSGNLAFDTLFPPTGNEAALIAALLTPGSASDTVLTNFAATLSNAGTSNPNTTGYSFFNFPIGDPGTATLDLVDFGHIAGTGDPVNTQIGTVDIGLTTNSVPEPASLALLAAPAFALMARRNRKRR